MDLLHQIAVTHQDRDGPVVQDRRGEDADDHAGAGQAVDPAAFERRRRLSLRSAVIALIIAGVGFPLGMSIGGSDQRDTAAGMLILAAIAGLIACPWIVRAWQSFMRRRMVAAAVAGRTDIEHIDGETQQAASTHALSSEAFSLAAFRDSLKRRVSITF